MAKQDQDLFIGLKLRWGRMKLDYDVDGNIIYRGYNYANDAAEAATDWMILKYTYSAGDLVDVEKLAGAWSNRASLGWDS